MKFFTFATVLILVSCRTSKVIPLKGSYEKTPIIYNSDKSINEVWDNLIDLFAQKGLSIKFVDKNIGLIISNNTLVSATWEDKNGKPVHPEADIVVWKIYNAAANAMVPETRIGTGRKSKQPDECYAEWNVRLKANGTGTSININLVNVQYEQYLQPGRRSWGYLANFQTTGNFERMIYNNIK